MPISRRNWLTGAGGVALASRLTPAAASPSDIRDDFPIARERAYLNNASIHPMSLASLGAAQEFLRARTYGVGPTASPDPPVPKREAKEGFAALINAKPSESLGIDLGVFLARLVQRRSDEVISHWLDGLNRGWKDNEQCKSNYGGFHLASLSS